MKILILANNDVGLYQFRRELIETLLKEHQVVISLPNGELVQPLVNLGCEFIDTPIDRRGINPKTDLKLYQTYRTILKSVKPDLVITYTIKPNVYGGFACRMAKIPYAVNITGLGTAFEKKGALRTLVTAMYKAALKKAQIVFFENSANRDTLVNEGIVASEKTKVLNGAGVNLEHYQIQPYPSDETSIHYLFLGRMMKEKGIDEFFYSAEKMKEAYGEKVCFDVVGFFDDDYEAKVKDLAEKGIITYHGYQKDPRPFYKACHCLVLPSYHEGMSNVLLEAAASGRPLITTDIPGCREAVETSISGLLCQTEDAESLFHSMDEFYRMTLTQKAEMGQHGRELMEKKFDKKQVVAKTSAAIFK